VSRREAINQFFRLKQSQKADIIKQLGLARADSFEEYKARLREFNDWPKFIRIVEKYT